MRRVKVLNAVGGPVGAETTGVVRRADEALIEDSHLATAPGWRRMSRPSKLAYLALAGARLPWDEQISAAGPEVGVVIGSRFGCLSLFEDFHRAMRDEGPRAVSPTTFTTGVLNAPVGHASLGQGLQGPCHTLVGSDAAGMEAVALAWELLQAGSLKYVFAVGVEEVPDILVAALRAASALPPGRIVNEGAWALLLSADDDSDSPAIGSVVTGRCGRGHDAPQRHAQLLRAAAANSKPAWVACPGLPGADGRREQRAARLAFGEDIEVQTHAQFGYSPGLVSAWVAASSFGHTLDAPVIATAAGGLGTTVAIRFDPTA